MGILVFFGIGSSKKTNKNEYFLKRRIVMGESNANYSMTEDLTEKIGR
jgi:hypothetical protein